MRQHRQDRRGDALRRASPGHQAGAPLRRARRDRRWPTHARLPPAIRPGLHCGPTMRRSPVALATLPPAIRPGLHCGPTALVVTAIRSEASPGHQAGAPLRHSCCVGDRLPGCALPPAIRPGLHCGTKHARLRGARRVLPPAIRPGLHCGQAGRQVASVDELRFPRPSGRGSIAA